MLEGLKEALGYVVELGNNAAKTEVVEIAGKTYARSGGGKLERYDEADYAKPVTASTLTALSDYIENCHEEFRGRKMIIHVESPTEVRLVSVLDADRRRETLFRAEAIVSEFRFDRWYDQEGFMLGLQANFQPTADLNLILKVSGNIEKKNNAAYSDDGVSQVVTMQTGVATKADALVPNPARLKPFRTFQFRSRKAILCSGSVTMRSRPLNLSRPRVASGATKQSRISKIIWQPYWLTCQRKSRT